MAAAVTGGPVVAVCGLHGGAGTTTIALTLAAHAARQAGPGAVLLTETDPAGGGIACALDAASPHGLAELAALRAAGAAPAQAPFAELAGGLRICAAAPGERQPADIDHVAALLLEAAAAHSLVVVDAGTIREPHRHAALQAATVLVWTASATAAPAAVRRAASSPLARPARHLPWLLAVNDTTGARSRPALAQLRTMVPGAQRVVLAPALAGLPLDHPRREDVARELFEEMAA